MFKFCHFQLESNVRIQQAGLLPQLVLKPVVDLADLLPIH